MFSGDWKELDVIQGTEFSRRKLGCNGDREDNNVIQVGGF